MTAPRRSLPALPVRVATGTARALNTSEATVRKHLENLYGRLEVSSRTEALARISPAELSLHTSVA